MEENKVLVVVIAGKFVGAWASTATSPENLPETQILGPHPRYTKSGTLGVRHSSLF